MYTPDVRAVEGGVRSPTTCPERPCDPPTEAPHRTDDVLQLVAGTGGRWIRVVVSTLGD